MSLSSNSSSSSSTCNLRYGVGSGNRFGNGNNGHGSLSSQNSNSNSGSSSSSSPAAVRRNARRERTNAALREQLSLTSSARRVVYNEEPLGGRERARLACQKQQPHGPSPFERFWRASASANSSAVASPSPETPDFYSNTRSSPLIGSPSAPSRLPPIVKSTITRATGRDEDWGDADGLFKRITATPGKVRIPHSIPEPEKYAGTLLGMDVEDVKEREERAAKADKIKRLLSKGAVSTYCPMPCLDGENTSGRSPPPPPAPCNERYHTPCVADFSSPPPPLSAPQLVKYTTEEILGTSARVRGGGVVRSRSSVGRDTNTNTKCDWSLAGVTVTSPASANTSPVRRPAATRIAARGIGQPPSAYNAAMNKARQQQQQQMNSAPQTPTQTHHYTQPRRPAHSASLTRLSDLYLESDSSSDSDGVNARAPAAKLVPMGHSDPRAERAHLLALQQTLARQVAAKSRLVAARAIIADPSTACGGFEEGEGDSPPPSPPYLPVVQVREAMFS